MSDATTPDAIRTRSFSTSRRGYEKAEVESFLEEVASLVADLQQRLSTTDERLSQLGITELPDLKAEIDTVGEDVREILQAARDAAEDMRDRANADAVSRVDEAQSQAERLRGEAWDTSHQMLEQVRSLAEELKTKASEEVLFLRAEAEREALRMTGDARRDAEELLRSAKDESETLQQEARDEAESIMAAAAQSADLAQERVRALEQRREELMKELEEARETLTEVEETIEGKRSELTHATTDPAESSVRVLTDENKPSIGDWIDDDATVRLVAPPPVMPLGPVDADELVAEVESLRTPSATEEPLTGGSGSSAEVASLDFEITSGDLPAIADSSATAEVFADTTPEEAADLAAAEAPSTRDPAAAESPSTPEPAADDSGVDDADAPEPSVDSVPAVESEAPQPAKPAQEPDDPGIADLFASLRTPSESSANGSAADAASDTHEQPGPGGAVATAEPEPDRAAAPEEPSIEVAPLREAAGIEPWDLRDQMLVPVTNGVLRSIKREIVDVQNLVLEELRTEAEDWRPKRAMFDSVLAEDAQTIAVQAYEAGVNASGELADRQAPKLPSLPTHSLSGLVTDLWEAVVDAIEHTAGGSTRERGASVGRIFRAWRTDEAERRVRQVAHAEYNAGMAAGLDALGIPHTMDPAGRDIADPEATVILAS